MGDVTSAARGNNRSVEEEDQGAYLQADFTTDWGIPLRGNIGVRYVETDRLAGLSADQRRTGCTAHDYCDMLPSLNLVRSSRPTF